MNATIAIQYCYRPPHDGEIMGLDVAITDFLKAWFRHAGQKDFLALPDNDPSFDRFKYLASEQGVDPARCIGLNPLTPRTNMGGIDCVFRPDPALGHLAWTRASFARPASFATCGLVHTMSGQDVAAAISDLCLAPTTSFDALICPSRAIRDVVRRFFEIQESYINHRFGGSFKCPVETPVIPLGIDTQRMADLSTPQLRVAQRSALNVADDEVVVLFVGRLSFATKAHPAALMKAAEKASTLIKKKIRLVFFGYFKPREDEQAFRVLSNSYCQNVVCEFIDNKDDRFPDGLWAGADIFTSLVDNIQESFGLTPVEAMACSLPVLASDWDGYRDSIVDGETGFLVPTYLPPSSAGTDIAEIYAHTKNYGAYLVASSQSTALDIDIAAKRLAELADSETLRQTMGQNGRARARALYDWSVIVPAYMDLWNALSQKRSACASLPLPEKWPAFSLHDVNPWDVFSSFPTEVLNHSNHIMAVGSESDLLGVLSHAMNYFMPEMLMPRQALIHLHEIIRQMNTPMIGQVLAYFPEQDHAKLLRCIGWLLKHDLCCRKD